VKVALITGGTKGIGLGIAKSLIADGIRVAITGRTQATAQEVAAALTGEPDMAIGIGCDVRDLQSQEECVSAVLEKWGRIDYVIANAGVGHFSSIVDLSPEQWQETIDVNLTGVYYTIKSSVSALQDSKGYFITIASLAGTNFFARGAAYNASKFGLVGFTQAVMLDLRQYGIKTTTIMPGSVATYFNGHVPSEADDWKIQPEDIGQIVSDLLKMHPRTLPSKVEVRPTIPGGKK